MSGPVSVPVVHRRAGVTVKVDPDALAYWKARGLPERWTWTEAGPTYSVDGEDRAVIETILGRPGKLGPAGSFDLTLANLVPLDGSEPNLKALEFDLEDAPAAASDAVNDPDVIEAVSRFGRSEVTVAGWRPSVTTRTQTTPDGTVITTHI